MTDEILKRIREALARGPSASSGGKEWDVVKGRLFDQGMDSRELMARFAERAASSGADVRFAEGNEALEDLLKALLEDGAGRRIAVAGAKRLAGRLGAELSTLLPEGFELVEEAHCDPDRLFAIDATITDAVLGIAETGSILLQAGDEQARLLSLVPEAHIVPLWPDQIVPDLLDGAARIQEIAGEGTCNGMTLISGPSKTADIELSLVVGVHGPARLHVILMGPEPLDR